MIKILLIAVMVVCGLLSLLLPEDKLVNKDKLKPNQDAKQVAKQTRTMGIIFVGLAILFFFIM